MLTCLSRDRHVEGSKVDEEGKSDGLTRARRSDNACPVVRNRESDGSTAEEEAMKGGEISKRKWRKREKEEEDEPELEDGIPSCHQVRLDLSRLDSQGYEGRVLCSKV